MVKDLDREKIKRIYLKEKRSKSDIDQMESC